MDAVLFIKEYRRMCDTHTEDFCVGCPLKGRVCGVMCGDCETIVKAVEKWSAEHPVKTRLMDFLEKYPKATLDNIGLPTFVPRHLGYCEIKNTTLGCAECKYCAKSHDFCWNLPLEE